MSDGTAFKTTKLPGSFLGLMEQNRVIKLETRALLRIAFDHGGYIAGGFGTVMARHYLGILPDEEGLFRQVRKHLGDPVVLDPDNCAPFRNAKSSDIDVWFPDARSLHGFEHDPRLTRMLQLLLVKATPTVTGTATEYMIERDARVQVISKYLAPLEDQIARFDIYNGMVGLTDTTMTAPEYLAQLEQARMLHVSTWESPWTINRVFKWLWKKSYTHVTPSVAHHMIDNVIHTAEWMSKWPTGDLQEKLKDKRVINLLRQNKLRKAVLLHPNMVQGMLQPALLHMTGEQLLQISTLFKQPIQYDIAMREIRRRMPPR